MGFVKRRIIDKAGSFIAPTKNLRLIQAKNFLAGAVGIEPTTGVLETHVIPFHHAPMGRNYTGTSSFEKIKGINAYIQIYEITRRIH